MNKKTLRIAGWALGLSMTVAGIGVAVGANAKAPMETKAATSAGSATVTTANQSISGAWAVGAGSGTGNSSVSPAWAKPSPDSGSHTFTDTMASADTNGQKWTCTWNYTGAWSLTRSGGQTPNIQFGKSKNPPTTLTFVSSPLTKPVVLSSFSAKYGDAAATSTIKGSLYYDDTLIVAGAKTSSETLETTTVEYTDGDLVIPSGSVLKVVFSDMANGVKVYNFAYTLEDATSYSVTYDANGGTGSMSDGNSPYLSGSSVTVKANSFTAPSGQMFDHWDTKADDSGTDYNEGDKFNISGNTTLYAQWADIPTSPYIAPSKTTTSGYTGQSETLSFTYGNLENDLTIISADSTKVTVDTPSYADGSGTVKINFRTATISPVRVSFKDGDSTLAYCDVSVTKTSISGMPSTKEVRMGDTLDLGELVTVTPVGLSWNSSQPGKATVNSNGVVTPVALGETTITATSTVDGTVSASCTVTIQKALLLTTDTLSGADFTATEASYVDFSDVSKTSKARYAGNTALNSGSNIQLRSDKSTAGIISTRSGGKRVKSIAVTFTSGTSNGRVLDVYGSNDAYTGTDASVLYGSGSGTKVASFTKAAEELSFNYSFVNDYKYIGIRSNNGAMYLSSVSIVWEQYDAEEVAYAIKTKAGGWNNNVSTGSCNSNYESTKEMILTLSDSELNTFKTSEDGDIASARATYQHWCFVNGDASPWSGAIVVAGSYSPVVSPMSNTTSDSSLPLLITVAAIGVATAGGYFFLSHRRREE